MPDVHHRTQSLPAQNQPKQPPAQLPGQAPGQTPTPKPQLLAPSQLFQKFFPKLDLTSKADKTGTATPVLALRDVLSTKMGIALSTAQKEWDKGVKETKGRNRGPEVDKYAKAVGGIIGETWCGYFLGYAYKAAGLKDPIALASTLRAKAYFGDADSGRKLLDVGDKADPAKNKYTYNTLPIIPGDVVIFNEKGESHLGMVESYNSQTGVLVTLEGNSGGGVSSKGDGSDTQVVRDGNAVVRKTYNLSYKNMRDQITGFGRPAPIDFA